MPVPASSPSGFIKSVSQALKELEQLVIYPEYEVHREQIETAKNAMLGMIEGEKALGAADPLRGQPLTEEPGPGYAEGPLNMGRFNQIVGKNA